MICVVNLLRTFSEKMNVWFINIATTLQVLLAALVTGLSSALEPTKVSHGLYITHVVNFNMKLC